MAPIYRLSPSILSADFARMGEQLAILEEEGCSWLHVDIMDGHFVPPISFGCPVIKSIRRSTKLFFDTHIMAEEPIRYVEAIAEAGADLLTVHQEACSDLEATLKAIREAGMKVGVTVKPHTPTSTIEGVLDLVDMVLLMTVEPGYGGQGMVEGSIEKIADFRKRLDELGYTDLPIEIDGGAKKENVDDFLNAGASVIVAGSGVFGGDIAENVRAFHEKIEAAEKRRYGNG